MFVTLAYPTARRHFTRSERFYCDVTLTVTIKLKPSRKVSDFTQIRTPSRDFHGSSEFQMSLKSVL